MRARFPGFITVKEWCCLYDAACGRLVGRAAKPELLWMPAADGAVLHPPDVLRALSAAGCLRQVRAGRWCGTDLTEPALSLRCLAV